MKEKLGSFIERYKTILLERVWYKMYVYTIFIWKLVSFLKHLSEYFALEIWICKPLNRTNIENKLTLILWLIEIDWSYQLFDLILNLDLKCNIYVCTYSFVCFINSYLLHLFRIIKNRHVIKTTHKHSVLYKTRIKKL